MTRGTNSNICTGIVKIIGRNCIYSSSKNVRGINIVKVLLIILKNIKLLQI